MKRSAFTLIELLVVISIIALLVGLLLPALGAARSSARNAACLSHVRGLAQANTTFSTDRAGAFVAFSAFNPNATVWPGALDEYYAQSKVSGGGSGGIDLYQSETYLCPETAPANVLITTPSPSYFAGQTDRPWEHVDVRGAYQSSYGINAYMMDIRDAGATVASFVNNSFYGSDAFSNIMPNVNDPANSPLFLDAIWVDALPLHTDPVPAELTNIEPALTPEMRRVTIDRHGGRGTQNVSFLDGHAESIEVLQLWSLKWNNEFDTEP